MILISEKEKFFDPRKPFASKRPETHEEWQARMGGEVLAVVRSGLYLDFRFLDMALSALTPVPDERCGVLATDGVNLYYQPSALLRLYQENPKYLNRLYLHTVFHCVFRHLWLKGKRDARLWNLACDIAVEQTIDALQVPSLTRPVGWLRQKTYQALRKNGAMPAAGPIYRWLAAQEPDELQKLHREFVCDSHRLWPKDPTSQQAQVQGRRWEQLGRETRISMQQAGQQAGQAAGAETMQAQIEAAHSRRLYKDFLRRFAVMREEPRLDPDEFDLGYYSYGLRTYGNLPLIEPLESRESKKIRDFVIVIDTSESTSGELVKAFLKETFGLLKTGESFFAKCNIAVMQCDDAVRDLTFLHSTDELDRFAACLTLTGGGGTDFRPAFAKIEELRRDGTLRDLQGVLYFTDGKGTYPTRRPPYETAFLFLETGTPPPDTPPWAMRLVLSPEEFLPDPVPKTPEIDWQENEAEDLPEL
jgi:predicted metal-dependent peptidase